MNIFSLLIKTLKSQCILNSLLTTVQYCPSGTDPIKSSDILSIFLPKLFCLSESHLGHFISTVVAINGCWYLTWKNGRKLPHKQISIILRACKQPYGSGNILCRVLKSKSAQPPTRDISTYIKHYRLLKFLFQNTLPKDYFWLVLWIGKKEVSDLVEGSWGGGWGVEEIATSL